MPYSYLEDVATADVAFEASGGTLEAMFAAASDATMNVMVRDLSCIADAERRSARFAGRYTTVAHGSKITLQVPELGAFSRSVTPLERNQTKHFRVRPWKISCN